MRKFIYGMLAILLGEVCFAGSGTQLRLINESNNFVFAVVRDNMSWGRVAEKTDPGEYWQSYAEKGKTFFAQVGNGAKSGTLSVFIVEVKDKGTNSVKGYCRFDAAAPYGNSYQGAAWQCTTSVIRIEVTRNPSDTYKVLIGFYDAG